MFKLLSLVAVIALAPAALAQEPSASTESEAKPTKATFLVTGLHCPPCTKTVSTSLQRVDGIVAVEVDWKTKSAAIEFDEAVLPAQRIALLVAKTPHMMGGGMHYGAWLLLRSSDIKDDGSGKQVQVALGRVKGIKQVVAYPKQHAVGVLFDPEGELTTQQLIEALKEAGFNADVSEPTETHEH